MFSHLTIGTNDLARAMAFYDAVLAPLGIERVPSQYEKWAAWQRPREAPKLWVGLPYNQLPASWGWMAALVAPSRAAVRRLASCFERAKSAWQSSIACV